MMPYYLVEFVRVDNDDSRRVLSRYHLPEGMGTEFALADMTDNQLID